MSKRSKVLLIWSISSPMKLLRANGKLRLKVDKKRLKLRNTFCHDLKFISSFLKAYTLMLNSWNSKSAQSKIRLWFDNRLTGNFRYPFGQPVKGFSRIRVHKSYGYYHREDLFNITAGKEVYDCSLIKRKLTS